jgi:hypothetical protein
MTDVIEIIIREVTLGAVAKVGKFYAMSLPETIRIKDFEGVKEPEITNYRSMNKHIKLGGKTTKACWKLMRVIYAIQRMTYVVCIYYTLPLLTVFLPYFNSKPGFDEASDEAVVMVEF